MQRHMTVDKKHCYHDFDIDPACEICGMRASEQYYELSEENKTFKKRIKINNEVLLTSAVIHVIASLFILYILFIAPGK